MIVAELFATLGLKPDEHEWGTGHEMIEGVNKALEAIAAWEGVKKIYELVASTSEAAIAARRMGQSLGLSSAAVQELDYAARASGASTDDLRTGIQHLSLEMANAKKTGSGPLVDALQSLNVSFDSVKNKSPDEILAILSDRFADMPDGMKKTGIAMQAFGRGGAALIPMLDRGSDGIAELRNEAKNLGIVIDDAATDKFIELEESTNRIKGSLTGLKNQAVIALLPVIQEMADALFKWVDANREVIASSIQAVVEGLITAIKALADVVGFVVELFQDAFSGDAGAQAILIGVAAIIATLVLPAFLAWAAATIAATAPLIAIGLVVAGVAYGVLQLVKHWDAVKAALGRAWNAVKEFGRGLIDGIKSWIDFILGIPDAIEAAFQAAFDAVIDGAARLGAALRNLPVIKQLGDAGEWISRHVLSTSAETGEGLDAIDNIGGVHNDYANTAPVSPNAAPRAVHVETTNTVTVNAASADAEQVGKIVDDKLDQHHDRVMRDAHAASRGDNQ